MRLSWQEIRSRARGFSERWRDARYEKGETQSFYNEFFHVFGVDRKKVAIFERRVELIEQKRRGYIDLLWPGVLLIEQKSAGRDLLAAEQQAFDYVLGLKDRDQPRWVLTCDFQRFRLLDLETRTEARFTLPELYRHVEAFAFVMGVQRRSFGTQAAVNIKAAELMGRLHDALAASGYRGHALERLLVRLLFCLFADDTGIFEKDDFLFLVEERTAADGGDVGRWLNDLFDVLDTPEDARQATLDPELARFPYVNGALFTERLRTAHFDARMRDDLITAARFDWGKVSPAIFGSLFQSVMAPAERRKKGAHYTTETNIMKVIGPLFLDELRAELDRLLARRDGGRRAALLGFQERLAGLTFLDPACGCGNFLVVTFRALRAMELEVLCAVYAGQQVLDVALLGLVSVEQFHGIEYEEFPAYIAEVAMWMADHLANTEMGASFGKVFARIPLRQSAHIRHADALEIDWNEVLPAERCFAVLGNPPFVGQSFQSPVQRTQMVKVINNKRGRAGSLDFVGAWFILAGRYLGFTFNTTYGSQDEGDLCSAVDRQLIGRRRAVRVGFVSTNSITQGEQVAQLWPILYDLYGLEISFAHRTFAWGSDAKGKAHVHVVIIGLVAREHQHNGRRLFSYNSFSAEADESVCLAISPYLTDASGSLNPHLIVNEAPNPLTVRPSLKMGSKLVEGGFYIFDASERARFLDEEPAAERFLLPLYGSVEFIRSTQRWILALQDVPPDKIRSMPLVAERVRAVRLYREASTKAATRALARYPQSYEGNVIPDRPFLVIPQVSSERREYIPIGWLHPPVVPSDKLRVMLDAELWHFGLITSHMHMAWMRYTTGRLKSDYMYSVNVVYNTFPWPDITPQQREKVDALAQAVLDARAAWPTSSLADLYDPDTMPANLRKAHAELDRAVDRLYRREPFASDRDRVEHLFGRYEALVNPLEREAARQNRRVARRVARTDPA